MSVKSRNCEGRRAVYRAFSALCHSGRGSYFSCYDNSILYNGRVEIGGYTIKFYKNQLLPQKSWDFCIQPTGWCTTSVHQMGYPFIFNEGLQIFKYL